MISGPTPSRAYIFWASAREFQGAYNIFGYENTEVERLFQTLRTTRNEAAVRSTTRRLQRELLEDPPALFLAWRERARAIRKEFAYPTEPGVDPIFFLWRWTRRTDTLAASVP
jgi:ABC-type oligopeptide transport system substrate-binding subunit